MDVATHASETLNKNGNVVFMTPTQRDNLTNQQMEILKKSGKKLIMVTDDVFGKIQNSVETFDNVYSDYNNSFEYHYVAYDDLSKSEQNVFDSKDKIIALLSSKYKICENIKISETICTDVLGELTLGVHKGDSIVIKRSVLSNPEEFCGILMHELCHHQHGYEDNSRDFENDLTDMLGYIVYKLYIGTAVSDHRNIQKKSGTLSKIKNICKLLCGNS